MLQYKARRREGRHREGRFGRFGLWSWNSEDAVHEVFSDRFLNGPGSEIALLLLVFFADKRDVDDGVLGLEEYELVGALDVDGLEKRYVAAFRSGVDFDVGDVGPGLA